MRLWLTVSIAAGSLDTPQRIDRGVIANCGLPV